MKRHELEEHPESREVREIEEHLWLRRSGEPSGQEMKNNYNTLA